MNSAQHPGLPLDGKDFRVLSNLELHALWTNPPTDPQEVRDLIIYAANMTKANWLCPEGVGSAASRVRANIMKGKTGGSTNS